MAVEKMRMVNVIGDRGQVNEVLGRMLRGGEIQLVSALDRIEENKFTYRLKEGNIDQIIELNAITPFPRDDDFQGFLDRFDRMGLKPFDGESGGTVEPMEDGELKARVHAFFSGVQELHEQIEEARTSREQVAELREFFTGVHNVECDIAELRAMKNFGFRFGLLTRKNQARMKANYENLFAVAVHLGGCEQGERYLMLYPMTVESEIGRVLRSLDFREYTVPERYSGRPQELLERLGEEERHWSARLEELTARLHRIQEADDRNIRDCCWNLRLRVKIEEMKRNMVCSPKYFYLTGWVSEDDAESLDALLKDMEGLSVSFMDEEGEEPPTKLRNPAFFRPFESVVTTYGVPNYREVDPTVFLSLTYMLMFGMMFGDVGQGGVLMALGFFLRRTRGIIGDLMIRLGGASVVFGFLYGSLFGFEDILPALMFGPFSDINRILVITVALGVVLLLMSFGYGVVNNLRTGRYGDALFGNHGVAGILFYLTLLALVFQKVRGTVYVPAAVLVAVLVATALAMIFRVPLGRLVAQESHGGASYAEEIFGLAETAMNLFSGTLSFIRIGAFAISHAGLFLAFETMAKMTGNPAAGALVIVLGNIVIIGLEGLIVTIQGLRLQYYELFSKFYIGDGRAFEPAKL